MTFKDVLTLLKHVSRSPKIYPIFSTVLAT